jgi:hypothetical protein
MSIAKLLAKMSGAKAAIESGYNAVTSITPDVIGNAVLGSGAAIRAGSENVTRAMDDFTSVMGGRLISGLSDAQQNATNAALKNSLGSGYDATNLRSELNTAAGRDLSDVEFANITKARDNFLASQKEGNYGTLGSFEDMARNLNETGELFSGYSRAGQTRATSPLTNLFSLEDKTLGQEVGMLATAGALGGLVNYAAGGEFESGAGVGALAAVGLRGAGRMVQQSMGDIEVGMMKKLMGEDAYGALVNKPAVAAQAELREIKLGELDGKTIGEIRTGEYGELHAGGDINQPKLKDYFAGSDDSLSLSVKAGNEDLVLQQHRSAVLGQAAESVRTQALNAIGKMTPDEVKGRGIGASYAQKMLTSKDKGNMGTNMRIMTVSGAALAGVPFTGRRNDHSSGFNKNRGNKI